MEVATPPEDERQGFGVGIRREHGIHLPPAHAMGDSLRGGLVPPIRSSRLYGLMPDPHGTISLHRVERGSNSRHGRLFDHGSELVFSRVPYRQQLLYSRRLTWLENK